MYNLSMVFHSLQTLTIPTTGVYSDGELSPGEYVDVHFEICLTQWEKFSFFVDVSGVPDP